MALLFSHIPDSRWTISFQLVKLMSSLNWVFSRPKAMIILVYNVAELDIDACKAALRSCFILNDDVTANWCSKKGYERGVFYLQCSGLGVKANVESRRQQ